jgi:uncharacterized cupredoxin-like copper-binding protein
VRARAYLAGGVVTVLLTANSVAALATTGAGPVGASSCRAPSLPGQRVSVVLADMGGGPMMMGARMRLAAVPQTVDGGTVSLLALNHGSRTHEMVVLPLSAGLTVGDRRVGSDNTVDEAGSLAEASLGCGAGRGDGIQPGQAGWVTLTLRAGRYELLCNEPGHYAAGMFAELDVA